MADNRHAWSVSAVVPHYGDPTVAMRAVHDLLAQSDTRPVEVIVVDDCSPLPFPDRPDVTVIRRAHNGGFGAAVNSGAAAANGDLLMIVNSDVRLSTDLVADLLRAAAPLMPAIVGPLTKDSSGEDEPTGRRFPTAFHWAVESLVLLQRFAARSWYRRATGRIVPRGDKSVEVDWLQGSLLLLPLEQFLAVSGFDERFYLYSEEVDLQRRLRSAGVRAWLLPSVTIEHVGGASTEFERSHEWLVRSRLTYADKWGGLASLRRAMWTVAVVNLVTRSVLRALGRPTAPRVAWHREVRAARTQPWPDASVTTDR